MFKRVLAAVALIAAACLISIPLLAREGGPGGPQGMHHGPGGLPPSFMMSLRAANLSATQWQQVHQIFQNSHATVGPLFKQLHSIDEQISAKLLGSGTVAVSDLQPLETQAESIHQQIDAQSLADAVAIRNILSVDQISKMAAFNAQMSSLHQQIETLMRGTATSNSAGVPPPPME
ncbi:MAG TPA: hypothetical protein VEJ86_09870 [Candidatus Binataceae bacterium]|nr:hypothetical protein [Candidatus Binataceae bacterium]